MVQKTAFLLNIYLKETEIDIFFQLLALMRFSKMHEDQVKMRMYAILDVRIIDQRINRADATPDHSQNCSVMGFSMYAGDGI
ncbi:MAG: hypothetical protein B2I17_04635 [Thermoplasmatales archaeon B_DKE]|nr:MAG: hypothetical protein B2I17_04635 [Thermoplasmatales archaeon B_DKE]